jgi:hypothetical protein
MRQALLFGTWQIFMAPQKISLEFRHRLSELKGKQELDRIQALTKWVPQAKTITRSNTIQSSCVWQHLWRVYVRAILGKAQEPSIPDLNTLSLRKYKKMIDAWGGWNLFQALLSVLNRIVQEYNVSIANVATRYILDKSAVVAGVIIGVRLGIVDHRNNNSQVFNFSLDKSDYDDIDTVCTNNLFDIIGDCGDEYR